MIVQKERAIELLRSIGLLSVGLAERLERSDVSDQDFASDVFLIEGDIEKLKETVDFDRE